MYRTINAFQRAFRNSFICFAGSFAAIAIIPILQLLPNRVENIYQYVIATIFWLGLILGIVSIESVKGITRQSQIRLIQKQILNRRELPGIINFSINKKHLVVYAISLIGFLILISDIVFNYISQYILFPVLSITLFAFAVHCIIDGKSYKIYKTIKEGMSNV